MRTIRLAYRDSDRTPVIFAVRAVARRYYDLEVDALQIKHGAAYEAALFNGSADVIIEHLEYLYEEAAQGKKVTFFCAPGKAAGLALVVPQHVRTVQELRGQAMAVRSSGQPHAVTLWLRMLGMENDVTTTLVDDRDVGRWGQWKKVVTGECAATFMSPLYLPEPLAAGLKVLPVPDIPIVGHFAQACLSGFARERPDLLRRYVKAVVHALVWLVNRPDDAFTSLAGQLQQSMSVDNERELKRRFDVVVSGLKIPPYPTVEAIANTYAIATLEHPSAAGLNPLTLWDLHWVKELDDEGFIDDVIRDLTLAQRE